MSKRKLSKYIIRISALAAILGLSASAVYAWYLRMNTVGEIELKITKIDSEVYLYSSTDSNYNGIPDLLSDYTSSELAEIQTTTDSFPDTKRYYSESRVFSYVAHEAALSVSKQDSIDMQMAMTGVYPTMTKTFKFACINNSDMENYITFSFNEKSYTNEVNIQLLSTMSVRVGQVINNTNDTTSSNVSVVLTEKVYFCDFISGTTSSKFDVVGENDAYQIDGALNFTNNSNVKDFWFQFEMESYDSLKAHKSNISLTESQYQGLAGESLTFPLMELGLELRDEN